MVDGGAIAIIPARGGSKRIPRKNVMDFFGKPMIAWTITAARGSGLFRRIVVSTDDVGVADIAQLYGAESPFLRDRAHDDNAPVVEATLAALAQAESYWGERYTSVVQLMPNCPLRDASEIVTAFDRFHESGASSLISCFRYTWMNPWWAHRVDDTGHPEPLFKGALSERSQDLETLYCPTGAIWIANVAALEANRTFYAPGHIFHPIDWMSAIDIDDRNDLNIARAVYQLKRKGTAG